MSETAPSAPSSAPPAPQPPAPAATPYRASDAAPSHGHAGHHHPGKLAPLALAALGVVYGDIGTSPLYAFAESIKPPHGLATQEPWAVLGVLSLIFWSLMMVVTVKYLVFIMRAHNQGEGGILALLALVPEKMKRTGRAGRVALISLLVIAGAGLLYGDGMITPAISVLSAAEGLTQATHALEPVVLPLTVGILVVLFAIQRFGTGGIGRLFGPVMVVWFSTIAILGLVHLAHNPGVLRAIWPGYAVTLFAKDAGHSFRLLGSVVLAVTGGEALYADMGHFGARPIRWAWMAIVLPALLLSYFGQGALVLGHPEARHAPFFAQVPQGLGTYLLVGLATAATVIASQALISGAFSLTHQAVQLGYFPRVTIVHTAKDQEGQIYIPEINWTLAAGCIALVLYFREAGRIAAAYGIAVTGTMAITSVVYYVVLRRTWHWPIWKAAPLLLLFLSFDLPFFGANALKFWSGGWAPIVIAGLFFTVMVIWKIGRSYLAEYMRNRSPAWDHFLEKLGDRLVARVPGVAVFMSSTEKVPPILVHHARRIRVLHEKVLLCTVDFQHIPYVDPAQRIDIEDLGSGFYRVTIRFGFMDSTEVPPVVAQAMARLDLDYPPEEISYYLGRETFLATDAGRMGAWSERIFSFLSRNATGATAYFGIPSEQVVELGTQIDL